MDKDLVASETNKNESAPLLPQRVTVQVLVKKGDEIFSVKKASLSNLASELSVLSLEPSSQETTKPVDEPTVHQHEITESPAQEGSNTSADPVEEMSVDQVLDEVDQVMDDPVDQVLDHPVVQVLGDPVDQVMDDSTPPPPADSPEPPVNSPVECPTESSEQSESGNRRCRWLDRTMCMLILEVLLLGFPLSMAYYGITYFQHCPGCDKLPTLLLILALFSASTLISRIGINIARIFFRTSYDRDIVLPTLIHAGEILVVILYIAEFVYTFTMDSALCNEDLYEYVFYMNNIAAFFILILIFCNIKNLARCVRIWRE